MTPDLEFGDSAGAWLLNGLIAACLAGVFAVLVSPRVLRSAMWRAVTTPLASIIGSGFLVAAPLLHEIAGNWAPAAMAGLLALAYLIGGAVRHNIRHVEPLEAGRHGNGILAAEWMSDLALAFAYFVSVAYYLVLFGSFLLKGFGLGDPRAVREIVSVILAGIGIIGAWRGFRAVERIEIYAVSLKLAVIAALLAALAVHFAALAARGTLELPMDLPPLTAENGRRLLGLLIIVQGFETSRYLGGSYSTETRIASMRMAQLVAAAIYIAFLFLVSPLVHGRTAADVASIIDMVAPVASLLPLVVVAGALASQSSAAIADANGAAGLMNDLSGGRVGLKRAYPVIALASAGITWGTDVFSLITLASQCFAFYYALQCLTAALSAYRLRRRAQTALYAALVAVCAAVVLLGVPAEGG